MHDSIFDEVCSEVTAFAKTVPVGDGLNENSILGPVQNRMQFVSKDMQKAKDIALQLQCGTAWINKHGPIQPNAPFGGVKSSGFGVEFREEGLFENTDAQVVWS